MAGHRPPASGPNTIVLSKKNGSTVWLNQVCLALGWQAYFHHSPWRNGESEQTNEWGNAQPWTHTKRTQTQIHTYKKKFWHLIEEPGAAKALYSPQLAPSSDAHPKPSGGEPSGCCCFKEALMSFSVSSFDSTFGCVTSSFVLWWTKTTTH